MTWRTEETRDIKACRALRRVVFIEEQNVSEDEELDALDDDAVHLLAYDSDAPAGTARILLTGETAKIGRVCVLKPQRGTGFGAHLMRASIEACKARPEIERVVLGAQIHALGFYEKLGFTPFGPVYLDAGIEHRDMELIL